MTLYNMYIWHVKILAFILSIYILGLNFAPCEDSDVSAIDVTVEVSQIVDADQGHSDLDFCSPFCQCHCCHVHTIHFNLSDIVLNSSTISTNLFLHFDSLGKDIPNSILQPPQYI